MNLDPIGPLMVLYRHAWYPSHITWQSPSSGQFIVDPEQAPKEYPAHRIVQSEPFSQFIIAEEHLWVSLQCNVYGPIWFDGGLIINGDWIRLHWFPPNGHNKLPYDGSGAQNTVVRSQDAVPIQSTLHGAVEGQ